MNDLQTTERAACIRRICEDPYNLALKLIFADWLEENHPEEIEWVEQIRTINDEAISQEMSIGDKKFSARIRNGFFCQVAMTCDMFMENAKELFEQQPITKVELLDKFPEKLFLKDSPEETSVLFTWFLESPREFGEQQRFQEMLESIERDRARNYLPKSLWGFPAWQPHTSSKQLPEPIWERTKRARESIQESLEVLSQACVDFGRTLEGLPPLKWPEVKLR